MRIEKLALIASAAMLGGAAIAQTTTAAQPTTTSTTVMATRPNADRLFLGFAEDATIIKRQWWEAQFEYADGSSGNPWDKTLIRGIVAISPMTNWEFGGRVGFGSTDATGNIPDGSGATDLDVYGKYLFGGGGETEFAVGGMVTIPTGDDSVGLGTDAFSFKAFGAMRHHMKNAIFTANAGFRATGDGHVGDPGPEGPGDLQGKSAPSLGVGLLWPLGTNFTLVGEAGIETERFENTESDVRVLGGIDWRPSNRGVVRGALAVGLDNGAPDFQFLAGYAWIF